MLKYVEARKRDEHDKSTGASPHGPNTDPPCPTRFRVGLDLKFKYLGNIWVGVGLSVVLVV